MRTYTLSAAAELLGLPPKKLKNLADRGKLTFEVASDGLRYVTIEALREAGLQVDESTQEVASESGESTHPTQAIADVIAALERQVAANGELHEKIGRLEHEIRSQRLLTEQAESLQENHVDQLIEAHARIKQLEAELIQRRSFWKRRKRPELVA